MASPSLDQILTYAEALPPEEQEMLADLLKKRRIETWREETAAYAREAVSSYRTGKLKGHSAKSVIGQLRSGLTKSSE